VCVFLCRYNSTMDYGDKTMANAVAIERIFVEFFHNVKAALRRSVRSHARNTTRGPLCRPPVMCASEPMATSMSADPGGVAMGCAQARRRGPSALRAQGEGSVPEPPDGRCLPPNRGTRLGCVIPTV
jgi:hypothetical protein